MSVPAGHDRAHAAGEDRDSGGTGGAVDWLQLASWHDWKGILLPHTTPLHDY